MSDLVKAKYPKARCSESWFESEVYDVFEPIYQGRLILGKGATKEEAWQDAERNLQS